MWFFCTSSLPPSSLPNHHCSLLGYPSPSPSLPGTRGKECVGFSFISAILGALTWAGIPQWCPWSPWCPSGCLLMPTCLLFAILRSLSTSPTTSIYYELCTQKGLFLTTTTPISLGHSPKYLFPDAKRQSWLSSTSGGNDSQDPRRHHPSFYPTVSEFTQDRVFDKGH